MGIISGSGCRSSSACRILSRGLETHGETHGKMIHNFYGLLHIELDWICWFKKDGKKTCSNDFGWELKIFLTGFELIIACSRLTFES